MEDPITADGGDAAGRALDVAYRYLNRRARTETEVRTHLRGRGFDAATVQSALEVLCELGYVDDATYARVFSEDKRTLEQWGSERIARTLRARGIDPELIDSAVGEDVAGAEAERARELLKRRFRSPPVDARDRERALGVLLRKGFDSELALEAIAGYVRGRSDAVFE